MRQHGDVIADESTAASPLPEQDAQWLVTTLAKAGVRRGAPVALCVCPGVGFGVAVLGARWSMATTAPATVVAHIEATLRPRWVWWSNETPAWLLFGGWRADAAHAWAALGGLDLAGIPELGQLDLLSDTAEDGDDVEEPIRPDGYLRPEWVAGGWRASGARMARWAALAFDAAARQRRALAALRVGGDPIATAYSESAAELLCCELSAAGLPIDRDRAEAIVEAAAGPRPAGPDGLAVTRARRDGLVLRHVPDGDDVDLRNPAQVRAMLARLGFDLPDTRSWRLEPLVGAHPVIEALLAWRKAERIATTYGYDWLDTRVGADGRLRGAWTGCDGAAGRMTAASGLHNLPAELRPAVAAESGHLMVRADLGQIEPRILAAVSGDAALIRSTADDDLYAPVAARLGVERSVAKVAMLAAMYGQTSGAAGQALRNLETAYPTAMRYLRDAYDSGRAGRDVRTHGGRLVRMGPVAAGLDERRARAAVASRGRYARNAVIQGAAAEFFKTWAVIVRARLFGSGAAVVLCLHDELLVHVRTEQADAIVRVLHESLADTARRWAPDRQVRFVADVSVVRRWSEAKG